MRKTAINKIMALALAAALALSLAGCGGAGGASGGKTLKIGALFNVTGGQASLDDPGHRGFKLAAEQINDKGGINGRKIEIVSYDGKTDQTTCASNTKKLVDVDKVIAIGGLSDSNYAMAAGAVAQEAGIPFVFSGATTPSLPVQIGNFVFLTAFGDDTCGWGCADYMYNDLKLTKCYLLTDMSMEFTTTLAKEFRARFEKLGGQIVLEDTYMNKDLDFTAQIDRYLADSKGAEFLFFSGVPDDAGPLITQFRAKGVKETIISGDGFDTPLLWEIGGAASEGVIVGTHCSFENQDPKVQDFVKTYNAKYGHAPENAFAALGYDAMLIIAEAIGKCGDSVTSASIRDNLEKIDGFKVVTGTISYKSGHVPSKSVTINIVKDARFDFITEVNP